MGEFGEGLERVVVDRVLEVPKDHPFMFLVMSRHGRTPRTPLLNPMPSIHRVSPALYACFCKSLLLSRHTQS